MGQLPLPLGPTNPYSLDYFVNHSGVSAAVSGLHQIFLQAIDNPQLFFLVYVFGEEGTGKSHLLQGYQDFGARYFENEDGARCEIFSCPEGTGEEWIDKFVSRYEQAKKRGGVFLVESRLPSELLSDNPHFLSRIRAGVTFGLQPPQDEELSPLLRSLSERWNLSLSERALGYLLKRIPRDPLSFSQILGKISELSYAGKRPARLSLLRTVVQGRHVPR